MACVMLGPGDWGGTVSAFLINLCPLRLFCFPQLVKGWSHGHLLGSSEVDY